VVNYDRSFDVDLFVLELSALYFFSDASVQEFQPYMGGGFSIGMPHAKFKEERVSQVSGQSFPYEADQWSGEAGVHGILGAYYYVTNRFAFSAESRIDILQSKFPLSATNEVGQPEAVKLDVTYSGFVITFGISRSF